MIQKDYQKMEKFTRLVSDLENMDKDAKLQYFIQQLCDLNHETVEMLKTGNIELLYKMNETVENIYAVQSKGKEEAYQAIEEDCQIIYKNFNAIITMLNSNDKDELDKATSEAVRKFLHNIFDANVRIVHAYGLA